uniref:lysozyme n=1 Tax=Siphoviridae sp. ctNYt19 TaxID=2825472 RepID=A0A8S5QIU8_9CAUD|nr:MAG TPA: PlyB like endolysin [Siphoviridae sp. ctNYt19]
MRIYNVPDVSEHQPNFDFTPYAGKYAILRAGVASREDYSFRRHVSECQRLGITIGVYFYSYALNVSQAIEEAQRFVSIINGVDIGLGAWLDMEDADHYKVNNGVYITHDNIAPMSRAFCDVVAAAGYYTGIYTSLSWLGYLAPECDPYDKWVAAWGNNDGSHTVDTSAYGTIQQYTSNYGTLDENVIFVDTSIYRTGVTADRPTDYVPSPAQSPAATSSNVYVAQYGDTLSGIAARFGTTYQHLAEINGIADPNKIYAGQEIVIDGEPVANASGEEYYTIQDGDTLSGIGTTYGVSWQWLAEVNSISDPDLIYPGNTIRVR